MQRGEELSEPKRTNIVFFKGSDLNFNFTDRPDITTIGNGVDVLTEGQIPHIHFDLAIILAHGRISDRNTPKEAHIQRDFLGVDNPQMRAKLASTNPDIADGHRDHSVFNSTLDNILTIAEATTPADVILCGCHGGALIKDIERNLEKIALHMKARNPSLKHMTISAFGSSKHVTTASITEEFLSQIESHHGEE
jgi:hypothetical protein